MSSSTLDAGRRARTLVPTLARPGAIAEVRQAAAPGDDLRMFWTTFSGALVFLFTYLS